MANLLYQQIEMLSREKHIEPAVVVSAIEDAMVVAARKYYKTEDQLAEFEQANRTFADLFDGAYVRVKGSYQVDGSVKASTIVIRKFEHEENREVELHGSILNFVSNANFTVRGVKVDASASTAKINCPPSNVLANNLQVEVEGTLTSTGKLMATEVKCEEPQQGASIIERSGVASKVDTAAKSFTLADTQAVVYTTNTLFVSVDPTTLSGKRVEVEGTLSGSVLTATKIKLDS